MIEFKILKKSKISKARLGLLKTSHGVVETPCLVPVATQAAIKTLTSEEVEQTQSQILIANTFHLHLKPGEKIVKSAGGLHEFMNWTKPLMTDSGGFQVFSLGFGRDFGHGKILKRDTNIQIRSNDANNTNTANKKTISIGQQPKLLKITGDGVFFTSPLNGEKIFLGPKESIKIQEALGADIIFAFDECTSPMADYQYTKNSLLRTHRWAIRCLETAQNQKSNIPDFIEDSRQSRNKNQKFRQALFGIVQGGRYKDLRIESARFIGKLPFDGFGIGGEFGDNKKIMVEMIDWATKELPEEKPRHLLGIGRLEDIAKIVKAGVDTFDCIVPTRYARHGAAFIHAPEQSSARDFVSGNRLDMSKTKYLKDKRPLDKNCSCFVCRNYRRNYIGHLFRAGEITALKLLTFHNLYFFNAEIAKIREKIKKGKI